MFRIRNFAREHVRLRMIDKFAFDDTSRLLRSKEDVNDGLLQLKQIKDKRGFLAK